MLRRLTEGAYALAVWHTTSQTYGNSIAFLAGNVVEEDNLSSGQRYGVAVPHERQFGHSFSPC